ncbi:DUF6457 domain-containing protein [Actinocatenispora comari]
MTDDHDTTHGHTTTHGHDTDHGHNAAHGRRAADDRTMADRPGATDDRNTLDAWTDTVCRELGIAGPVDRAAILDLTKDVARGVARPAAPLTAYLVGLAVGAGGDPADVAERVGRLAGSWPTSRTAPEH